MYKVVLINLTPDARAVAPLAIRDLGSLAAAPLEQLLRNFCAIDPIENAVADTEIRVQVRAESYLLRTEQAKLILYDANRRDLSAQILGVEEVMRELDGTAALARQQSILQARQDAATVAAPAAVTVASGKPAMRPRLVVGLCVAAGLQLAAIAWLRSTAASDEPPPDFVPLASAEADPVHARLVGVYLTGSEPGQHGIAVPVPGEMKLFELAATEAPRVVYAAYRPGRIGGRVWLATDQPGGLIEVTADGDLVYGGETYRRLP